MIHNESPVPKYFYENVEKSRTGNARVLQALIRLNHHIVMMHDVLNFELKSWFECLKSRDFKKHEFRLII